MVIALLTLHDESSPSHIPQVSNVDEGQQRPSSANTPRQHCPLTSTNLAKPSHVPQASSRPLTQHVPSAAIVAYGPAQHVPLGKSMP